MATKLHPKLSCISVCKFLPCFLMVLSHVQASPINQALTIKIEGNGDSVREYLSNDDPNEDFAYVGTGGRVTEAGVAGILFFKLPELAETQVLNSSSLSVTLSDARNQNTYGLVPTDFNVDRPCRLIPNRLRHPELRETVENRAA